MCADCSSNTATRRPAERGRAGAAAGRRRGGLFGKRGKALSANARLDQAAESVEAHAAQLGAAAARERAKALAASGKRAER